MGMRDELLRVMKKGEVSLMVLAASGPKGLVGGGGGYFRFQVMGMVKWGQKSKPIRITRPKINPQKSHATFLSLKNF